MQTIAYIPPGAPATALACAILSAQADRMDRLARIAESELQRTNRTRDRLDYIIGALIDRLDTIDAATVDLEPSFGEVRRGFLDEAEEEHEGDDDPDGEPSLGSHEAYDGRVGSGTYWNGVPMSAASDECEDVSEDEGAQCDDEGDIWSDGPTDRDALSLEFGEAGYS